MLASIILCHNVAKTQIRFCGWWWVFMIFIIMNATGTPNTHLLKLLAITPFTSKGQLPQDLGIKCGSIYNFHDNHVIGVCPPSQSESQNWAQPRNKRPHAFAHLVIATKMCLSWLIIIQSCSFDCRINKPFDTLTVWSAFLALFNYLDILRVQRIMGFYILITHKSTRSENPITTEEISTFLVTSSFNSSLPCQPKAPCFHDQSLHNSNLVLR